METLNGVSKYIRRRSVKRKRPHRSRVHRAECSTLKSSSFLEFFRLSRGESAVSWHIWGVRTNLSVVVETLNGITIKTWVGVETLNGIAINLWVGVETLSGIATHLWVGGCRNPERHNDQSVG